MTTQTENITTENIPIQGESQNFNVIQGGNEINYGPQGTIQTTTQQTTTTINNIPSSGLAPTSNIYQIGQGQNGLVMGVGGGVQDDAVDITYSSNTKNQVGTGAAQALGQTTTTTTTTTRTQYELGQNQGQIIQRDGNGLVMGVGGGIQDDAVDVTYSSNTGKGLGAAAAKTTNIITTTTNNINDMQKSQFELGQSQGIFYKGKEGEVILGVGGGVQDDAVDVTYSTYTGQGQGIAQGKTTTTTTTTVTKTNYGAGSGVITGTRKSIDISKYATNQVLNEGVDIKSLEIYNKTTLLKDKVQHIIKREIQPIVKTVIKPIIQKEIQPIVQREIQPIIQKEIQPIVQREIQPIIQKEVQPIVQKEIQPKRNSTYNSKRSTTYC